MSDALEWFRETLGFGGGRGLPADLVVHGADGTERRYSGHVTFGPAVSVDETPGAPILGRPVPEPQRCPRCGGPVPRHYPPCAVHR